MSTTVTLLSYGLTKPMPFQSSAVGAAALAGEVGGELRAGVVTFVDVDHGRDVRAVVRVEAESRALPDLGRDLRVRPARAVTAVTLAARRTR